jgi:hypothetical protein
VSGYPTLLNKLQAVQTVSEIESTALGRAARLLIEGIEQFFLEQPSQLRSPFDLAFLAVVLKDRMEIIEAFLKGLGPAMDWGNDEFYPKAAPILDPSADIDPYGIRGQQATNYAVTRDSDRLQSVLLTLISGVQTWQRKGGRQASGRYSGTPVTPLKPDFPLDYLFMVMAVDYALRPGTPARRQWSLDCSAPLPSGK